MLDKEEKVIILETIKGYKNKFNIDQQYKKYYNSELWKCEISPNKAHFWILNPNKYKDEMIISFRKCKFCDKEKTIVRKNI